MHESNNENLAPSSSMQLELANSTTITCLQNVGSTTFDKLVTPFVHVEQDLEFWNSFEGSSTLKNMMSKYEKGLVVTHIGGQQFSNLTNYSITLSIYDPNVVANLLSKMKGPPFG
jgi:hypothetical protein